MGKFFVDDSMMVHCVEAPSPRNAASLVAGGPVIPQEANPDPGLVVLSVYKWANGVDGALAALPDESARADYCRERLEFLADYAKLRQ